jgi:hypothetical protein
MRRRFVAVILGCVTAALVAGAGVAVAAEIPPQPAPLYGTSDLMYGDAPTIVAIDGETNAQAVVVKARQAVLAETGVYDSSSSFVAPNSVQGPPRPGSVAPRINPQQQAGHVSGTPQYANRIKQGKPTSVFHASENADSLTLYAWQHGKPTANPNIRIFDFQRPIGTGFYGGSQTQVRVSINSRGQIHGSPWGPELP